MHIDGRRMDERKDHFRSPTLAVPLNVEGSSPMTLIYSENLQILFFFSSTEIESALIYPHVMLPLPQSACENRCDGGFLSWHAPLGFKKNVSY